MEQHAIVLHWKHLLSSFTLVLMLVQLMLPHRACHVAQFFATKCSRSEPVNPRLSQVTVLFDHSFPLFHHMQKLGFWNAPTCRGPLETILFFLAICSDNVAHLHKTTRILSHDSFGHPVAGDGFAAIAVIRTARLGGLLPNSHLVFLFCMSTQAWRADGKCHHCNRSLFSLQAGDLPTALAALMTLFLGQL
jgi:hypothetical protein